MGSETQQQPGWVFRLRGPKGTPAVLELPDGAETKLKQLVELAGKSTRVAAKRLIIRAGFPPKELTRDGVDDSQTVLHMGLANRDVLHIDRKPALDESASEPAVASASAATAASSSPAPPASEAGAGGGIPATSCQSTPSSQVPAAQAGMLRTTGAAAGTVVLPPSLQRTTASPGSRGAKPAPKRRRVRMPGSGRRLGDGTDDTAEAAGGGEGEAEGTRGSSLGTCRSGAEAAEHAIAADLVSAASGGGATVSSTHRALRKSLREARTERGAEEDARLKVAAALAGKVKFRSLEDGTGRVEVEYATGRRSACKREVITDIPVVLLPAILNLVASDTDPVSRNNLKIEAMALVSPRMFWAIVRHGGVSPDKSFHDATCALAPDIDWQAIEQRDRQRPERYADYVSH